MTGGWQWRMQSHSRIKKARDECKAACRSPSMDSDLKGWCGEAVLEAKFEIEVVSALHRGQ